MRILLFDVRLPTRQFGPKTSIDRVVRDLLESSSTQDKRLNVADGCVSTTPTRSLLADRAAHPVRCFRTWPVFIIEPIVRYWDHVALRFGQRLLEQNHVSSYRRCKSRV